MLGVGQEGLGGGGFDDAAFVHEGDLVGDFSGEVEFVGYDEHGHSGLGEVSDDLEDFADEFGVEGGGWFVEEHKFGVHGEGSGDGDALLLAAGELGGVGVGFVGEADAGEEGLGGLGGLVAGLAEDLDGAFGDVLEGGHVGEEVEALEDHSCGAALPGYFWGAEGVEAVVGLAIADEFAVEPEGSGVESFELVDAAEEGGLAGAGGSDDADDLAGVDLEGDAIEGAVAGEGLADVDGVDHWRGHRAVPRAKRRSMRAWAMERTETVARYQTAATMRSSMTLELA